MEERTIKSGDHDGEMPQPSALVEEVRQWNTPLIGAYLLWRFTTGYRNAHPTSDAPIGLLHFVATGILTSSGLSEAVSNRRKSLESYSRGFEADKRMDVLLSLQQRVKEKRPYTLKAIDYAIAHGFLVWDIETGKLHARNVPRPPRGKALRYFLQREGEKAETLGKWFAPHTLSSIASYLKLSF